MTRVAESHGQFPVLIFFGLPVRTLHRLPLFIATLFVSYSGKSLKGTHRFSLFSVYFVDSSSSCKPLIAGVLFSICTYFLGDLMSHGFKYHIC